MTESLTTEQLAWKRVTRDGRTYWHLFNADGTEARPIIGIEGRLIEEIEHLRGVLKPFAEAAKQGQVRLQILENGGVGAMGCRDGYLDQAMAHLCVKEFRDAQAALEHVNDKA